MEKETADSAFLTTERLFTEEACESMIRDRAEMLHYGETLQALAYAKRAHAGQTRKNSRVPYINHPLTVCCHAIALGLIEEEIWTACLLHDVVEDCGISCEELPVSRRVQELVGLLSHGDKGDPAGMETYYRRIATNPTASLIKCLDRCSNLNTMIWGFSRRDMIRYIRETEDRILPLLAVAETEPRFRDAVWLLRYQMLAVLDICKRALQQGEDEHARKQ